MFPSSAVNSLFIPWDFILILAFFGIVLPWRGAARVKRILAKPEMTSRDRFTLYGSTILFQWLIVVIVAWRCAARSVSPAELGIAAGNPLRIAWTSLVVTGLLCTNQVFGLRRITKMPAEKRGSLFAITEKIMPRTHPELLVYSALACTAGISEEFLYRGFVFMAFVRVMVNHGSAYGSAAILSSAWFSIAHLYQGRRGLITTFVVGMILASLRIWTGSLIPVVIAHIGIDLTIGICASKLLGKA